MSSTHDGGAVPAPGTSGGRPARPGSPDASPGRKPGEPGQTGETGTSTAAPLVAGVVLVGFGILLMTQVVAIKGDGFSPGGPRFFPLVVVTLLTVLAAVYLLQQVWAVAGRAALLPSERFSHMPAVLALLGLLVAYAFVLAFAGYVVATAAFFVGAARTMGSRLLARDLVVGVLLSLLVYLTFTRALGVFLPQGVLPL